MIEAWAVALAAGASTAVAVGAGAAVAAGALAAGASVYGADKAAAGAKNAQNIAQNQYQNTVNLESPYNTAGVQATDQLGYLMGTGPKTDANGNPITSSAGGYGSLNAPFTQQDFYNNSPAYQFQLQQGRNGVLNGASSGQGGLSGAALQGLTDYNQASANTAWGTAFNQYQTQNQNVYNRLANIANLGQSAASGTAQTGASLANTAASASIAGGNAQANGISAAGTTVANLYAAYGAGGPGTSNPPAGQEPVGLGYNAAGQAGNYDANGNLVP